MRLSDFVPLLPHGEVQGPEPTSESSAEVELTHAIQDSRRAMPGSLFCALPGERSNGHEHVAEAVANGASAVLCGHKISACPVPQIIVEPQQLRFVAGVAASILAGSPSQAFDVCAVTGTNGKTTVAHLYQQACDALSVPCGRAGTLGLDFEGTNLPAANTSVSADCLHSWLQGIGAEGARTAVLEASSHGIHQHRLAGVRLTSMVWTNLSQDHLDYHHSMDAYAEAKAGLLALLAPQAQAWLPVGNEWIDAAVQGAEQSVKRWQVVEGEEESSADVVGHLVSESPLQIQLEGCAGSGVISSGLVGRHNAENLVCAFLLLRDLGHDPEAACHALSQASVAPGRLEPVCSESPWQLFVDYAHTPEALSRVLKSLRAAYPHQRLGVVFGAGGDRDATKRPAMGAAAAAGADWCIVTSDNPRTEDPEAIVQQVAAGARAYAVCEVFCEVDRRAAIHQAVDRLSPGEVLVVAGKGHEDYQEINGVRSPFLDHDVLREAVRCTV